MSEYFYDFTISGEPIGFSYLYLDTERLFSLTRFQASGNDVQTSVFELRMTASTILAIRHASADWVSLTHLPSNHYPSCAYPLLLNKAQPAPHEYVQVSDIDGSLIGETQLIPEGRDIVETRAGVVRRRFTMDGETPVRIDWGGAVSNFCVDGDEAARGSGIPFKTR